MFAPPCVANAYCRLLRGATPEIQAAQPASSRLPPGMKPGYTCSPLRVSRTRIDLFECRDLRLSETGGGFRTVAKQRGRLKIALGRIVYHSILDAIARIAGCHCRRFDGGIFVGRYVAGWVHLRGLEIPGEGSNDASERSSWGASDDAVIIGWEVAALPSRLGARRWNNC